MDFVMASAFLAMLIAPALMTMNNGSEEQE